MQNLVQTGNAITVAAAPYAVDAGDGCLVGSLFGVAAGDAASGAEVVLAVTGVFTLPKVSLDDVSIGEALFWDDAAKLVTVTATANTRIGVAVSVAGNPSSFVDVRLHGAW